MDKDGPGAEAAGDRQDAEQVLKAVANVAATARQRIGALMVEMGLLDAVQLDAALSAQRRSSARLGLIVTHTGLASAGAVAGAAAQQAGLQRADLRAHPLDASLLEGQDALAVCLAHRIAPWRRSGDAVVYAAADEAEAQRGLAALGVAPDAAVLALAPAQEIAEAMLAAHGPAVALAAATRAPAATSVRTGLLARWRWPLVGALALAAVLAPAAALITVFSALLAINALNAAVRIAVLRAALAAPRDPEPTRPADAVSLPARLPPPRVTLLIPLLDEPETAAVLFDALERLDWPRELLDVKLILEEGDLRTRAALEATPPPPFCTVITAPAGAPRTKPRALNVALDFAEGEIIGVYDAEDLPEPDQIRRVARILRNAPPEVACVQCRLAYYNARENWLTRCFAIEYAMWFDVLLRGFRALRLPIPLGGTSVFFRRAALEQVGGWDAHNVTEDAELGMRLARAGFRCEISASCTYEEASSQTGQWLRQRSRWLKGFMATWLAHMRRPAALWRDLGARGFIGFQALFLGAAAAYLGLPAFWAFWIMGMLGAAPDWFVAAPGWLVWGLAATQAAGWCAMIAAALIATHRRGERWLWKWIPSLSLYWPLGAAAAWLAVVELFVSPTLWRKTPHGLGRGAEALRARAASRRAEQGRVAAQGAGQRVSGS